MFGSELENAEWSIKKCEWLDRHSALLIRNSTFSAAPPRATAWGSDGVARAEVRGSDGEAGNDGTGFTRLTRCARKEGQCGFQI